ncbi:MAG: hypothetical protein ACFB4I_12140 [Cyanophyceae cyanobacterium]
MSYVNNREISCFGLRRSGNHALINWIVKQNNDSFVHLNNVKLYTNKDPYKSFAEATISGINPLVYHQGVVKFRRFIKYSLQPDVAYIYGGNRPELDREQLRIQFKTLLIHSYEHYTLSQVLGSWFEEKRTKFLGKSQRCFDLLLLRDPYNTFASLIKRGEKLDDPHAVIQKWIDHAKEYLGLSSYLQNRVSVNYNYWFTDKQYRQELAQSLGLSFTDAGIDTVSAVGRGSSFDKTAYDGKASQMPVLLRYQKYLDHPVMLKVLANKELNELSEEIFGPIL